MNNTPLPSALLHEELANNTIATLDLFNIFQRLASDGITEINIPLLIDLVAEYWSSVE
jgi:hypothetical protein